MSTIFQLMANLVRISLSECYTSTLNGYFDSLARVSNTTLLCNTCVFFILMLFIDIIYILKRLLTLHVGLFNIARLTLKFQL